MFKARLLAQQIFLCTFFVICNSENHEKIAFMEIKKSVVREPNAVRAGTRTTYFLSPGLTLSNKVYNKYQLQYMCRHARQCFFRKIKILT